MPCTCDIRCVPHFLACKCELPYVKRLGFDDFKRFNVHLLFCPLQIYRRARPLCDWVQENVLPITKGSSPYCAGTHTSLRLEISVQWQGRGRLWLRAKVLNDTCKVELSQVLGLQMLAHVCWSQETWGSGVRRCYAGAKWRRYHY